MKKSALSIFLMFLACNLFAATVDIYKDKTIYRKTPMDGFIGFNKNVQVKCENEPVEIFRQDFVKSNCFLCNIYNEMSKLNDNLNFLKNKNQILENISKNISFQNEKSLSQIDKLAKEMANTEKELKNLNFKYSNLKSKFKNGAASAFPYFADFDNCQQATLSFKGVNFTIENELIVKQVAGEKAKIEILKLISLTNKSGIDISATKAVLHFKKSSVYQKSPVFRPWIVSAEMPMRHMFKSAPKAKFLKESDKTTAQKQNNRTYLLKNLFLVSDGKKHSYILSDIIKIADYKLISYPYVSPEVFREISFNLTDDMESDKWKVKIDNEIFNNISGTYEDGKYKIIASKIYDIKVERKKLLDYKEKTGIFGNRKKISDGYKIVINNVGDQSYSITVIDRIPVSKDEKIKVENVKISDPNCSLSDKGKLVCKLDIDANTKKEITVKFDIVYDKDIDIFY